MDHKKKDKCALKYYLRCFVGSVNRYNLLFFKYKAGAIIFL